MKTILKAFSFLLLSSILFASCTNKPKIQFVDKDGNIHLLTREGERIANIGLQKIIARGIDTVVTIDGEGRQKIWTATGASNIDTTKIQFYLKKRNGNNVNIYVPSEGSQEQQNNSEQTMAIL
ncbi:hypothetical protein [Sphingobacterium prati]|uniref:hypothetical protein n=1 Tax=Sphingobacterium prati TaxID=2737006 RepID=UPI0015581932|nr:hypothetical protein [Sphingobacterium prati]NPE46118.1 hypothetical protein [Sphingobacterium prati]